MIDNNYKLYYTIFLTVNQYYFFPGVKAYMFLDDSICLRRELTSLSCPLWRTSYTVSMAIIDSTYIQDF